MFSEDLLSSGDESDKLALVGRAVGPRDLCWALEDRAAAAGYSPSFRSRIDAGVGDSYLELRFQGVSLDLFESPPRVASEDHPSVRARTESAAAELDRLTAMSEITWYPRSCHPPDPRICTSQLIVKPDKVRVVHDWSNPAYGLNGMPVNPPVESVHLSPLFAPVESVHLTREAR